MRFRRPRHRRIGLGVLVWGVSLVAALAASSAHARCERHALTAPEAGSTLAELQPELLWSGDAQARHRLQLAVLVPEGRVLQSVDMAVVGTRWRLPAPLTVTSALFKVIISRDCPAYSVQDLYAEPVHFAVQAEAHCAWVGRALQQAGPQLRWAAQPTASGYLVRLYAFPLDPSDSTAAQLLLSTDTQDTVWALPSQVGPRRPTGGDAASGSVDGATAGAGVGDAGGTQAASERVLVASVQARCGWHLSRAQTAVLKAWP